MENMELKNEQSETAAEIHGTVSRRTFVKAASAAGALAGAAALAGCASDPKPTAQDEGPKDADNSTQADATPATYEPQPDPFEGAQEFFAACPPECQHHNLKALVKDGKVVRVTCGVNNESMPCMMGLSRVEWLNSPERLTAPLLRDGDKGSGKFKEISWDEAIDLIAEKLQDAIDTVGNKGIVIDSFAGNFNTISGQAKSAFIARIGGAMSLEGTLCCAGTNGATIPVFGKRYFDTRNTIEDANYIIIWGNNPAVTQNGYFNRYESMMAKGGKIVTIDPICSETASKTTEWLPIRPTTDTALALGMLKVIVDEGLHNEQFLKEHSTAPCLVDADGAMVLLDADDPTSYAVAVDGELVRHDAEGVDPVLSVKGTDLEADYTTVFDLTVAECEPWTPEAVEAETWVPAAKVAELARDYAKGPNSMIIQNMGGFMRTTYGTLAVASQNNLAVFCGQVGGAGNGVCDAGGINNLVTLKPMFENPKVDAELPKVARAQFATHVMNDDPNEVKVFISLAESPMTQWPNTNMVKQALCKIPFVVVIDSFMTSTALYADLVLPCAAVFETEDILCNARSHLIQLSDKAVEAPGQAHDDLWIFTQLANKMGVGEDFNHDNEYFIRKALEDSGFTYDQLKKEHAIDAYPKDFIPYKGGEFYTATKKAEIYQAPWLAKGVKAVPSYYRCAESVGGSSGLDATYPLAVVQRKLNRTVHSTFGGLKSIGAVTRDYACVMINPADAAARNIKDDDVVVVFNDRGEHRARAIVTDLISPGVLCAENGWWEQQGGSSSYITNDAVGPLATEHCCNETLADVRKEA